MSNSQPAPISGNVINYIEIPENNSRHVDKCCTAGLDTAKIWSLCCCTILFHQKYVEYASFQRRHLLCICLFKIEDTSKHRNSKYVCNIKSVIYIEVKVNVKLLYDITLYLVVFRIIIALVTFVSSQQFKWTYVEHSCSCGYVF